MQVIASQNKFALHEDIKNIRDLCNIIRTGSFQELKDFIKRHPHITLTMDILTGDDWESPSHSGCHGCGVKVRSSALDAVKQSYSVEKIVDLYNVGLINSDNEVLILAQLSSIWKWSQWPGYLYILEKILLRPDAKDIRFKFALVDDKDHGLNSLFFGITHYYGKLIPMIRKVYNKMLLAGFPATEFMNDDLEFQETHNQPCYAQFKARTSDPNYIAWLKIGTSEEDPDFLPIGEDD